MTTNTIRLLLATSLLTVSGAVPRPALAQPDPMAAHALVGGELAGIWPTVIGPVTAGIAAGRSDWRVNLSIGAQF